MTPSADHPTDRVVLVADLLDRPGESREIDLTLEAPTELGRSLAEVRAPLRLAGVIESVVDGLLVRGRLETRLGLACARCLADTERDVAVDVVELFSPPERLEPDDELDEGYEIVDAALNLEALLRDALVPAAPYKPLCDPSCKGLCAQCGADRNAGECGCVDEDLDPRWGPLAHLDLPQG